MGFNVEKLFNEVLDPRIVGRCDHKLCDILFIALCTFICNGEDYGDMELFGNERYDWLKSHLELPNGIPSKFTFERTFSTISPQSLAEVLEGEGANFVKDLMSKQICIDGKKLKGSSPKSKGNSGIYLLNAWVAEDKICIGQSRIGTKKNEITEIPKLLENLSIEGAIISIDAIGTQTAIVEQIIEQKADYFLALKKNQKHTLEYIEDSFFLEKTAFINEEWEYDHGRFETRKCSVLSIDNTKSPILEKWKYLKTLIKIEAARDIKGKKSKQNRYYLSSISSTNAAYFNQLARKHWGIENHLHWHLDVSFSEDKCRCRKGYAPENLALFRKIALQRTSRIEDKLSIKKRRYKASLNNQYLEKILLI